MTYIPDFELERKDILSKYRNLITIVKDRTDSEQKKKIRKAFKLAVNAHKDMRRKSGEPYIYHPLEVARIAAADIGLGATGVICALLHDVVEDTDYTLDDIKDTFGTQVAKIVDGLTKIDGVMDMQTPSMQAENFRKILLTLSEDVRVILIKLADRLHNMRTLDSMPNEKQLKIASETAFFYGPLAHRLGLFNIKSELEDLVIKYTEPDVYKTITKKIASTQEDRDRFIQQFVLPIKEQMIKEGFSFEIISRVKSVSSIWQKMKKKEISFEEVYDLFAIRIIVNSSFEAEKVDCWKVYSIITSLYRPNSERLRDWISIPKANGYESLHTTVMSNMGKWVEIQVRSNRMNEIAEKGYAAHWKYKGISPTEKNFEQGLDEWLSKIKTILKSNEASALEFLSDIKLDLFSDEMFIFTPKGEMKTLPKNATVLDFAYVVHSQLGKSCIGAKVNHVLSSLNHQLKSGDQVEIITSKKQVPQESWLEFVVTSKARDNIKESLKEELNVKIEEGKLQFESIFPLYDQVKLNATIQQLKNLISIKSTQDLYVKLSEGILTNDDISKALAKRKRRFIDYITLRPLIHPKDNSKTLDQVITDQLNSKPESLLLDEDIEKIHYTNARCCNPIPGDQVIGYIASNNNIQIHRTNCVTAIQLMSQFGNRIIKAKWRSEEEVSLLAGIKIQGLDKKGLMREITNIISEQLDLNMRSLDFKTSEGVFEGVIMLYIQDLESLKNLLANLKRIDGIEKVSRINSYEH
ncbi:MAG: RelA/SpoT family protein [Bacteroidota bacterium]